MIVRRKSPRRAWPIEAPPAPATIGASPAAGALRRIWSFGLILALFAYALWNLGHAVTLGEVHGSHGWIRMQAEPGAFWIDVVLHSLVVLTVGGGGALIALARSRRREDTRQLDAYLQRREDARRGT